MNPTVDFHRLKILSALVIPPSLLSPGNHSSLYCLRSFAFSGGPILDSYGRGSFGDSVLVYANILLPGCTSLSVHLLKGVLIAFKSG